MKFEYSEKNVKEASDFIYEFLTPLFQSVLDKVKKDYEENEKGTEELAKTIPQNGIFKKGLEWTRSKYEAGRNLKIKNLIKFFDKVSIKLKDNSNNVDKIMERFLLISYKKKKEIKEKIKDHLFLTLDSNHREYVLENKKGYLRIKNGKLLLEDVSKENFNEISIEEIKNKIKELSKIEKSIFKEEEKNRKDYYIEESKKLKKEIYNHILYKMVKNVEKQIKSLRSEESEESKKVMNFYKESIGFEPSVLNFSLNSLSKFKSMCEFNRIISNVIFSHILLLISELNILHYMATSIEPDAITLKQQYIQLSKNHKNIIGSLNSEEVIKKFDELIEQMKIDFGASSDVITESLNMHKNIIKATTDLNKKILEFQKLLSNYWSEYNNIESEKDRLEFTKQFIDSFSKIKNSIELKNLYKIYTKNVLFFQRDLKSIMNENISLNFDKILESQNKETFANIYAEEKIKFDKMNKKCFQILGKVVGDGELGKMFDQVENVLKEIDEKIKELGENKKPEDKEETKEVKPEEKPENKNTENNNTKPEQENKSESKEDKNESKLIKQDLKILNNKNSKLKLIAKG